MVITYFSFIYLVEISSQVRLMMRTIVEMHTKAMNNAQERINGIKLLCTILLLFFLHRISFLSANVCRIIFYTYLRMQQNPRESCVFLLHHRKRKGSNYYGIVNERSAWSSNEMPLQSIKTKRRHEDVKA